MSTLDQHPTERANNLIARVLPLHTRRSRYVLGFYGSAAGGERRLLNQRQTSETVTKGMLMNTSGTAATIVLVHGAWADGSSWARVIQPLQSRGLKVIAAPIPLTSLSDDIAALERVLERTSGPVVLVAHAYAGAVVGASVNERIRSLVFIAALTPDAGETVAEVFYRERPHEETPQLAPDIHGLLWIPDDKFGSAFCQHASPGQAALLAATQRPIALSCIQEKAPKPAWKTRPSWYLVAEDDRMINPVTQRFLAQRMGAQIRTEKVDHAPLVTAPGLVVEIILRAIAGLAANP